MESDTNEFTMDGLCPDCCQSGGFHATDCSYSYQPDYNQYNYNGDRNQGYYDDYDNQIPYDDYENSEDGINGAGPDREWQNSDSEGDGYDDNDYIARYNDEFAGRNWDARDHYENEWLDTQDDLIREAVQAGYEMSTAELDKAHDKFMQSRFDEDLNNGRTDGSFVPTAAEEKDEMDQRNEDFNGEDHPDNHYTGNGDWGNDDSSRY